MPSAAASRRAPGQAAGRVPPRVHGEAGGGPSSRTEIPAQARARGGIRSRAFGEAGAPCAAAACGPPFPRGRDSTVPARAMRRTRPAPIKNCTVFYEIGWRARPDTTRQGSKCRCAPGFALAPRGMGTTCAHACCDRAAVLERTAMSRAPRMGRAGGQEERDRPPGLPGSPRLCQTGVQGRAPQQGGPVSSERLPPGAPAQRVGVEGRGGESGHAPQRGRRCSRPPGRDRQGKGWRGQGG